MKPPREGQHNRPGARRPGLSLDRFAAAKTSTYDKRAVLARKHHLKAQRLRGYRRLLERTGVAADDGRGGPALPVDEDPYDTRFAHGSDAAQQSQEAAAHAAEEPPAGRAKQRPADANGAREGGAGTPDRKKGKKFNALEVLARDKAREKEALEQQEAEAEVAAAERRAAIEAAAAARRAQGAAMRKKNARGQPVMRYRVDSILQRLEQQQQQQTQQQRRG